MINEKKILFKIFNKLQESKTITLNEVEHTYLIDIIKRDYQELKILELQDKKKEVKK